jgi:AcrR family transcriptional regulator
LGKKEEIIDTAIKIIQESNYQNMKTALIAEKLDISEGTIYNYFSSKREIFLAVIDEVSKKLLDFFIKNLNQNKSLYDNLKILGENFLTHNKYFVEYYKVIYKAFSELDDEELKQKLSVIFDKSIDFIYEKLSNIKEIKELKNKNIKKDNLKLIIYFLWGFGDISFKRYIVSDKNIIEEIGIDKVIEYIYKIIIL